MPSRAPKTAGAVADPAAGLSFSGVAVLSKPAPRDEVLVMAAPATQPRAANAAPQSAAPPSAQAGTAPNPSDPNVRVMASSVNGGLPPAGTQPQPFTAPATGPAPNFQPQANNVPAAPNVAPANTANLPPGLNVPPGATGPAASSALTSPSGGPATGGTAPNGAPPAASTAPSAPTTPTSNAAAVSTAPVATCDSSGNFPIYTIQPGDTLSGVAAKFGLHNGDVPGWKLIVDSNKPDLVDEDDLLQIDQKLLIPLPGCKSNVPAPPAASSTSPTTAPASGGTQQAATAGTAPSTNSTSNSSTTTTSPAPQTISSSASTSRGGVVHTVVSSQTLGDIATMYDVKTTDIVEANRLSDANKLSIGQQLFIPSPKKSAPPSASIAAPQTASASSSSAAATAGGTGSGGSASSQSSINTGAASAAGFSWPTGVRTVSSYFSSSHPLGIDIDLYSQPNGPIAAVAAGTVTFAGGNSCCSYGLYVTIDHGNGLSTLYAHMSKLNVTTGTKVSKGQVIGNGGRTGYATGNHLHLEVRKDGKVVNPLSYLP